MYRAARLDEVHRGLVSAKATGDAALGIYMTDSQNRLSGMNFL
jgi:hypothetical protein